MKSARAGWSRPDTAASLGPSAAPCPWFAPRFQGVCTMRGFFRSLVLVGALAGFASIAGAQTPEGGANKGPETVWPGITPSGSVVLPNGWSLRPAGRQIPLGDFPITMAEHPSAPILAVLHAGHGEHEVVTLDTRTGR